MSRFLIFLATFMILVACNKNDNPNPDSSGMFIKFFGGAFDDHGFSIIKSNDGGFYIAGSTIISGRDDTSIYVAKLDGNGNKLWSKNYEFNDTYDEIARDLILNSDGELIVAGYKENVVSNTNLVVLRIKNDNPEDATVYLYGDNAANEKAISIIQDDDNNYIIMGNTYSSESLNDMFLLKVKLLGVNGDTVWQRKIGAFNQDDFFGKLKKTQSNNLVWCGTTHSPNGKNMVLTFADSYGNLLYNRMFIANDYDGNPANFNHNQYGYDMDLLSDNSFIVAGSRDKKNGNGKDIFIVKTDNKGNVGSNFPNTDTLTLSPGSSQAALSIVAINDNEYVITGYINSDKGDKDVYVAKIDNKGAIIKSTTFGSEGDDIGKAIIKSDDGGFLIIGTINAANNKMIGVYKINSGLELTK